MAGETNRPGQEQEGQLKRPVQTHVPGLPAPRGWSPLRCCLQPPLHTCACAGLTPTVRGGNCLTNCHHRPARSSRHMSPTGATYSSFRQLSAGGSCCRQPSGGVVTHRQLESGGPAVWGTTAAPARNRNRGGRRTLGQACRQPRTYGAGMRVTHRFIFKPSVSVRFISSYILRRLL